MTRESNIPYPNAATGLIEVGTKVLVTTNNWFYGDDGREYRGVFGTVNAIASDQETLGIHTNRNATNWYAVIGNMTIAGCQIFYVIKCDQPPPEEAQAWTTHDGKTVVSFRPTAIYNADK